MKSITEDDFAKAADELGTDVATIKAVAEVESRGESFLADGRPQVLFEAHVFHRLTEGRHADKKDRNGVALSTPKWDRTLYGRGGSNQHDRLEDAANFDWAAAHRSCSWGKFQILGSNHRACGYDTIDSFVDAMRTNEGAHLQAFIAFIQKNKLDGPLRDHDWVAFARGYNGPSFATNKYDIKLRDAYEKWRTA